MPNFQRRLEALEVRHSLVDLPVVIVFASEGDNKNALVAEALRERGLRSGEARVMVIRRGKPS